MLAARPKLGRLVILVGLSLALLPVLILLEGLNRGQSREPGDIVTALVIWGLALATVIAVVRHGLSAKPAAGARLPAAPPRRSYAAFVQFGVGVLVVVDVSGWARQSVPRPVVPRGWAIVRPPHEVSALAVQGDVVWAGGQDGLAAIDRRTADLLPPAPAQPLLRSVKALLLDRHNQLWIAHGAGLMRYAGGRWTAFSQRDGLPEGAAGALLEDRQGLLWIGYEKGVARFDGQSFQPLATPDGLVLTAVDTIFQDREERLWFGSSSPTHGGLWSYRAGSWRGYSTRDGLAHNSVNAIIQDHTGALWFATGFSNRGGATRLSEGRWDTWTRREGLPGEKVRSIFEDQAGSLWFGSEYEGLAIYDGSRWRRLSPKQGLAGWEVKQVVQDVDGVYWLATEDGVTRIPNWDG